MENKNKKSKEIDKLLQSSFIEILNELQNKNPLSMLITIINIGNKISGELDDFISNIDFDQKSKRHDEYGILYDLFGNEKLKNYKENRNFDNLFKFEIEKYKNWNKKTFEKGIFKEHLDLFTKDESEQKKLIFEYYKKNDLNLGFKDCIINDNGEIELTEEKIKFLKEKFNKKNLFKIIIEFNFNPNKEDFNDDRKKYFDKICEIKNINIEEKEVYNKIKEIDELLKNIEINNIVEEYRKFKLETEKEKIKKDIENKLLSKIKEVKGKEAYFCLKDFIVSIYSSPILTLASQIIIRKLITKSKENLIETTNYKILKYITLYILPKNIIEAEYIKIFFDEFEENSSNKSNIIKKIKNDYKVNNLFMVIIISIFFVLFGNYIFLENKYFEIIIISFLGIGILYLVYQFTNIKNILIGGVLGISFLVLFFTNLPNYIKTSVLDNNNTKNKTQIILLSENNLYFSGSIVSNTNNEDIGKFIDFLLLQYEKRLGIELDKSELVIEKIKIEFAKNNNMKINKIDLGELEKIVQKSISKQF